MRKSHWPEVKKPHEIGTALECLTRKGSGEPPESRTSLTPHSGSRGTSLGQNHQWSLPGIIPGSLTACCVEALIPFPDRNSQRWAGSFCFLYRTLYNPHFTVCASASFYPHPSGSTLTPTHPTSVISSHSQLFTSFHFSVIGMPFLWVSLFSAFKIHLKLYLLKHNLLTLAWSLPFLVLALYSLLTMMFAKIISSLLSLLYLTINSLRSGTRLYTSFSPRAKYSTVTYDSYISGSPWLAMVHSCLVKTNLDIAVKIF